MKKILCLMLCVILSLSILTGCSGKSGFPEDALKEIWGREPDAVAEILGLDLNAAVVEGGNYYTFKDVTYYGEKCEMNIQFMGLGMDDDVPRAGTIQLFFTEDAAAERALQKIEKDPNYVVINEKRGLYTIDVLSEEQKAWIDKYTAYYCGEEGLADPGIRLNGGNPAKHATFSKENELPLVVLTKAKGGPMLQFSSAGFLALNAKERMEALSPNGYPVVEE